MRDYQPKPKDGFVERSTMFGTSVASDHANLSLTDQMIADMPRHRLEELAYAPNGDIRGEGYQAENGFEKFAPHRAYFALKMLDGDIDRDCAYLREIRAAGKIAVRKTVDPADGLRKLSAMKAARKAGKSWKEIEQIILTAQKNRATA